MHYILYLPSLRSFSIDLLFLLNLELFELLLLGKELLGHREISSVQKFTARVTILVVCAVVIHSQEVRK